MASILWTLLGVNTLLYVIVGRVLVSQPSWNRPELLRNTCVATILACMPIVGFIGLPIAGFLAPLHRPWGYLAAAIGAFVFLSVRPASS